MRFERLSLLPFVVPLFLTSDDPGKGSPGPIHPRDVSPAAEEVRITVTRLRPGEWEVAYFLAEPADRLTFTRDRHAFRHENWEVRTQGIDLVSSGRTEELVSTHGRAFKEVVVRFAGDPLKRQAEYPLTPLLSDGSEALFTGHLYVQPVRDGEAVPATPVLQLRAGCGEPILLEGRRYPGDARWTDRTGRGAYVYFGHLTPIESEHMVAIMDPGLPPSLRDFYVTHLPRLFHRFESMFGYGLEHRPTILVTYDPGSPRTEGNDFPGRPLQLRSDGDVVSGVIRFQSSGSDWAGEQDQVRRAAFHLLAHEAVHLWNGWRFSSREGRLTAWLHEGAADALAWTAAVDFGILDENGLRDALENALNRCFFAARGRPVREIMHLEAGAYSCGAMIQVLAGLELQEGGGLAALWRTVFDRAAVEEGVYDPETFFAALETLAGNDRLASLLRSFVEGGLDDPPAAMRVELARLGIDADAGEPPHERAWPLLHELVTGLMAEDCGGRFSVTREADAFALHGLSDCDNLPPRTVRVVGLEAHSVRDAPGRALMAAREACLERGKVLLGWGSEEAPLAVRCPGSIPPYLHLSRPADASMAPRPRQDPSACLSGVIRSTVWVSGPLAGFTETGSA
jgi:hypothetical protein